MADIIKKATRESYGNALAELGATCPDLVVLDADLSGATKTGTFKKAFPERHINCGIAEGNMMTVAAGIATTGKVPFASSFAMFAAGRAFEQVRNSIGYPHLNVKIGATHAGISVGEDGATHQCNEDIALMRAIPGMVVINPADDIEAKAAVKAAYEYVGPVYLRFGRLAVPVINDNADYKFEIGKGIVLREGKDVAIIATGLEVGESLAAAEMLAADGIDAKVINIHTIKPLDEELVIAAAKECGLDKNAIVCEDLGTLTYPVENVMKEYKLQGMRLTQFVVAEEPDHPYRGANIEPNSWTMVGTHDNEPIAMWAKNIVNTPESYPHAKNLVEDFFTELDEQAKNDTIVKLTTDAPFLTQTKLVELFASKAENVQVFFTDLLGLMDVYNRPGTSGDKNWSLRMPNNFEEFYCEQLSKDKGLNLPLVLKLALEARGSEFAAKNEKIIKELEEQI